jgi:ribosomal protein L32E
MKQHKFLRGNTHQYSKLGLRRNKKLKYTKAKGIDSKVRIKKRGHLRNVAIGFRTEKKNRGLVRGLAPVNINCLQDLKNLQKDNVGIVGRMGMRKKKEVFSYAIKNNLNLSLNPKREIEKIEEKLKRSIEEKKEKEEKKKLKDKKSREKAEKEAKKQEAAKSKEEKNEEKTTETIEKKVEEIKPNHENIKQNVPKKQIQTNNYGRGK